MNPPASYKVWHCSHNWYGSHGAYESDDCVVIAEIKDKAIGMALMEYPNTQPKDWSAYEISLEKEGVHHINSRCN
jgi:hypothetical protein